jgi:predicted nucleic acid-binding protein
VKAIVDAGPLYASIDRTDRHHLECVKIFRRRDLEFIVPAMIVTEVTQLVSRRMGSAIEAQFLRSLSSISVEAPEPDDWAAVASQVERYSNFPLGGADASVAVLADRLQTNVILTVDRRHFGALRNRSGRPYTLLPA